MNTRFCWSGSSFGDSWKKLLNKWMDLVVRYCNESKGADAPYLYEEMATVSFFSGAAWCLGGLALQEYGITRKGRGYGRADLWFSLNDREFAIEAKRLWLPVDTRSDDIRKILEGYVKIAVEDAAAGPRGHFIRAGAVFIIPKVSRGGQKTEESIEALSTALKHFREDKAAYAYVFPKVMQLGAYKSVPGVAVLLRAVDKS